MARVPYQVTVNGQKYGARITTQKDRHGNETFVATVVDTKGKTLSMGYGDTPFEACDDARIA